MMITMIMTTMMITVKKEEHDDHDDHDDHGKKEEHDDQTTMMTR